jgi:chromosome segregation ATPase
MFGRNIRTATVDTAVLEAEDAARRKREHDEQVASVRRRQAEFAAAQQASADHRRQVERDASDAKRDDAQRKAEGAQRAQWAWAIRRNELRDQVADLRRAIQDAVSRIDTAPMPEATAAAGERQVLEHRLKTAESEYSAHLKTSPL